MVFSLKQTGVPIGFALAGLIFPLLLHLVGWRGASLIAAAAAVATALVVELLRPSLDTVVTAGKPSVGIWRSVRFVFAHRALRVLGLSAIVYVIAQHTFTFIRDATNIAASASPRRASCCRPRKSSARRCGW